MKDARHYSLEPRQKFIVRNSDDSEALTVCFGVWWDGERMTLGGPIGMLSIVCGIMSSYPEWEEVTRITDVMTGKNAGQRAPKFKLFYRSTGKLRVTRQRHWTKLLQRLRLDWVVVPVKTFRRLLG